MGILYADHGKIYCNDYMEIYIPQEYFNSNLAINKGSSVECFGVVFTRAYPNGNAGDIRLFNLPTIVNFMVYNSKTQSISIHGKTIDVLTLEYIKDSYILHQTIPKGRDVANAFLDSVLGGKLPKCINYTKTLNMWWKNLEIAGISYKVPSKIYEMILAATYRNPHNTKERYGQYYGRNTNADGYDYQTGNVRSVVKDLSTFSGMVFEDIGTMISNGIVNSLDEVEEQVSPLEKIIHY